MNSDERACPWCAETIKTAAVVCRYCQRDVSAPQVAQAPPAAPATQPETVVDKAGRTVAGIILAVVAVPIVALAVGFVRKEFFPGVITAADMPKTPPPQPRPAATQVKAPPSLFERIDDSKSLADAIVVAKPHMGDTTNGIDEGTLMLASWMLDRLKWSPLAVVPETSLARMLKDSALERGQRICAGGMIVQIEGESFRGGRVYSGKLMTDATDVVSFVAVGSTGDLVAQRPARFCGIATGRDTYANAGGGTTHAVRVVGMFDLPENKK